MQKSSTSFISMDEFWVCSKFNLKILVMGIIFLCLLSLLMSILGPVGVREHLTEFPEKNSYEYKFPQKLKPIVKDTSKFISSRIPLNTVDSDNAFQNYFTGVAERILLNGIYYLDIRANLYDLNGNLFNAESLKTKYIPQDYTVTLIKSQTGEKRELGKMYYDADKVYKFGYQSNDVSLMDYDIVSIDYLYEDKYYNVLTNGFTK